MLYWLQRLFNVEPHVTGLTGLGTKTLCWRGPVTNEWPVRDPVACDVTQAAPTQKHRSLPSSKTRFHFRNTDISRRVQKSWDRISAKREAKKDSADEDRQTTKWNVTRIHVSNCQNHEKKNTTNISNQSFLRTRNVAVSCNYNGPAFGFTATGTSRLYKDQVRMFNPSFWTRVQETLCSLENKHKKGNILYKRLDSKICPYPVR
jgi:hypothetical protein